MMSEYAIGIDLGTTNSCICVYKNGKAEIIPNNKGNNVTPSVIAFREKDNLVGEEAKHPMHSAENIIFDAKRLIGRRFNDPNIKKNMKNWPFKVINDDSNPKIEIKLGETIRKYNPEEISAIILGKLKIMAECHLNQEVKDCVITVPAHFTDSQRKATINAGKIAGLRVMKILNEPTAAAIAYSLSKKKQQHNVLIYDLGGGTFDVSILKINGTSLQVLSTGGNANLGGSDFDNNLMDYVIESFKNENDRDVSEDKNFLRRLRAICERAKIKLTKEETAIIEVDNIIDDLDFDIKLTREKFEEINADLFNSTMKAVEDCLISAKLNKKDIDEIVMVGGSTRIPKVLKIVTEFFNKKKVNRSINPEEAVAIGAAIQASALRQKSKGMDEVILQDVVSHSLGIEIIFGRMSNIIPKNSPIPVKKTDVYFPTGNRQTSVDISIFEGENDLVADNHFLGKFSIKGFPARKMGETKFIVTFEIDESNILTVTCADKESNIQNSIQIHNHSTGLSDEEIMKFKEENVRSNFHGKEHQDARDELSEYCKEILFNITKKKTKLDESEERTITRKCNEIFKWLDGNQNITIDEYKQKLNDFDKFCKEIIN